MGVYDLIEELGAGGMGVVWRAHDRRLGRDVALKILPPHLATHPESLARFEREARGLASLSHPNIVSIFDLGESDGIRYLVTELLSGETLRSRIARGRSWRQAAEIGATIAEGLAAAHARGIIHRDLKPENVFITTDERVKILDFGLAKEIALATPDETTQAHHTEPGVVLGTLGYMSPEQLRGEELDFASDIFSLGCLLYEMLSGRAAFLRDSAAETIAAIIASEPRPPASTSEVPADLMRILQRCLAKEPRARFQSARDLALALRDLSTSRHLEVRERAPSRFAGMLPIVTAIVIVVGAIAALFFYTRAEHRDAAPPSVAAKRESVSLAIIPFKTSAEDAYAGEGLAESVFRTLSRNGSLNVVSRKTDRSTLLNARGAATHVLEGEIAQSSRRAEVHAQIVELASGQPIWTKRYGDAAANLLGIERSLSADVELFLLGRSSPPPPAQQTTVNAEAYREYLKGRHYWNNYTLDDFKKAIEHYQRSIDLDPTYALPYSGLADAYTLLAFFGGNAEEVMPKARAAAQRALELDPELGEAYTSLGSVLFIHDWKWREAGDALRRGVELNPRYPTAHHVYAVYLSAVGRSAEAMREITVAEELDPLSLIIYVDAAWIHYVSDDVSGALTTIDRALRHDPRSPLPYYEKAGYLDQIGRYADAIEARATAMRLEGKNPSSLQPLREALKSGGRNSYLRQQLALARAAGESHVTISGILLRLGRIDESLDELEKAVELHERDVMYLKTSATYASVRTHPRFLALLKKVGFDE